MKYPRLSRVDDEHGVAVPWQASVARDEQIASMTAAVKSPSKRCFTTKRYWKAGK